MDRNGAAAGPVEAMFAEALVHHQAGRLAEAAALYRAVLERAPDHVDAHVNLALVSHRQGALESALALYDAALALDPALAQVHNNRGAVLQALGRFEAAAESHRASLALRPASVEANLNLGAALHRLGRPQEAAASYRAALALEPDLAAAHANLGLALQAAGRSAEALPHHQRAAELQPDSAEFHNNLGLVLQDLGELPAAIAEFERAIARRPDFADAHMDLGIARLLTGDFAGGWPEYEWRLARDAVAQPNRAGPRWDGGDPAGRTILLQSEQGHGDAIQFIRYAPLIAARGGRVLVSCRPPLRRLFETVGGVAGIVGDTPPAPAFDGWAPMLSLPTLMGTSLATIPAGVAYLRADPGLAQSWRAPLAGLRGLKVGVVWRGTSDHLNDRNRSTGPAQFARFLSLPGLAVVSLQQDARPDERAALGVEAFDAGPQLGDFADTAAMIANLDLVVSVDTAVAHLAGALGAPVWTLIPFAPDWRWLLDREDSPWYPSMRLFRQPAPGDWASVMDRVRAALSRLTGG
jgi:tetratricopeptide (TPR) repeat protein